MQRARFERLVHETVETLPPEFARFLNNVEVVVRSVPSREDLEDGGIDPDSPEAAHGLFGLYIGIPLVDRHDYHMVLPDRIVIYQQPLERAFPDDELEHEVMVTVVHELAHHFGIDDDRLEALGLG
jgi:predicted Zn-dependent protease with MMP-like domain